MAYKNVKNVALNTNKPQTLYQHIRDFLTGTGLYNSTTGIGWTLLYQYEATPGSVSVGDWCCLKTTGEDGTWDFRAYFKCSSTGLISNILSGMYNTTLANPSWVTLSGPGSSTDAITTTANWTAFYLYADKNFLAIVVRAGTVAYIHRVGIADCCIPAKQQPKALLSAITAGSNKTFTVDDSNIVGWEAGNRILFLSWEYSGGGGYVEASQISANDTGTDTVTVLSNSNAYPAGTLVGQTFPFIIDTTANKSFSSSIAIFPGFGAADTTGQGYLQTQINQNLLYDSLSPNPFTGRFTASPILLSSSGLGTTLFAMPSWMLATKKRTIEEELHTDGTDTYRYFSFNAETYVGLLFKEV